MKKTIFLTILLIGIITFSFTANSFSFADLFKIKKVNLKNITVNNTSNNTQNNEKDTEKTIQIQTENIKRNKTIKISTATNKNFSKNLLDIPLVKLNKYAGFLYLDIYKDMIPMLRFKKIGSKYVVSFNPGSSLKLGAVSPVWKFKEQEISIPRINEEKYKFRALVHLNVYFNNFDDAWDFYKKLSEIRSSDYSSSVKNHNVMISPHIIFSTSNCKTLKTNSPEPYDEYYYCEVNMNSNTDVVTVAI